ncbi:MAG: phospholipase D-like domain-containing protein [Pseudanabaenaceae cyanobacterium bins.68]|nr:phospholipase D-like domain-containing protein [Pseudanabaenaceae cyanobacterium bins.68]
MAINYLLGQPRSKRRLFSYSLVTFLALIGFGYLANAIYGNKPRPKLQKIDALAQHSKIKVYMNHSEANSYTDPYRQIGRAGDDLEQILVDQIKQANSSVDVAIQEIRLPNLVNALAERKRAGVRVRLVMENSYNLGVKEIYGRLNKMTERERKRYKDLIAFADLNNDEQISTDEINQRDAITMLKNAGIEYIDDTADGSSGSGLMHHKFVVIDQKKLVTTSANFTLSDMHGDFLAPETRGNSNNMLVIDSPEVANLFTEEFNLMFRDRLFGTKKPQRLPRTLNLDGATVTVKFSPDRPSTDWQQTSNGLIGASLGKSRTKVDIALFVFAEPFLGNILEQQQVQVRALVDPGFAYREYATTLDMWGYVSTQDCKIGNGKPWQTPIKTAGIPSLPRGDILHHKYGVVDQKLVITGSHNWSNSANTINDETVVIIDSPVVAAHYDREFERLFDGAVLGPNQKVRDRAQTVCPSNSRQVRKLRRRLGEAGSSSRGRRQGNREQVIPATESGASEVGERSGI